MFHHGPWRQRATACDSVQVSRSTARTTIELPSSETIHAADAAGGWAVKQRKLNRDHPPRNILFLGLEMNNISIIFNPPTSQNQDLTTYALTWFIMVHHGLWNMRFSATLKIVGFMVHCNCSGTWKSCAASIHHDLVVVSTKNGCVCAQLSMISGHFPRCGWSYEWLWISPRISCQKKRCVQQWRHTLKLPFPSGYMMIN
jgi:hypothetical protein